MNPPCWASRAAVGLNLTVPFWRTGLLLRRPVVCIRQHGRCGSAEAVSPSEAPESAMRALVCMQQNLFISTAHFVQTVGLTTLEHGDAHLMTRPCD